MYSNWFIFQIHDHKIHEHDDHNEKKYKNQYVVKHFLYFVTIRVTLIQICFS